MNGEAAGPGAVNEDGEHRAALSSTGQAPFLILSCEGFSFESVAHRRNERINLSSRGKR